MDVFTLLGRRLMMTTVAVAMTMSSSSAFADFYCQVRPSDYFGVDGSGFVVMVGEKHLKVCSFLNAVGDSTPDVCKIWYAHVATARAQSKTITFAFHETQTGGVNSCAGIVDYSLTPPYYIISSQ